MALNAWVVFRKARIVLLGFSAVLALALSSLFIFLIIKEWLEYNVQQRIVVIAITGSHVFTAIFLYLMIVVQFRLWVDVARAALVILLETGGSVVFALETSGMPCRKIGLQTTCRTFLTALENAGWVVPGLTGFYVFALVIMHHVPKPSTQSDDLEGFFPTQYPANKKPKRTSVNSQTGLINGTSAKRSSTGSAGSSFIQNYTPSIMSAREVPPISVIGPRGIREPSSFRAGTPSSLQSYHSHSFSSGSPSPRMPQPQPLLGTPHPVVQYNSPYHSHSYSAGSDRGTPRSVLGSFQSSPASTTPLPNPFMDPPPRQRSPLSSEESMSLYTRGTLSPLSSVQGQGLPSSPRPLMRNLSPPSRSATLPTPFMPGPSPSPAPTARSRVASPGVRISQLPASLVASPAMRPPPRLASPASPMVGSLYSGEGRAQTPQSSGAYVPLLLSPALAPMVGLPQRPPGYGAMNY